MSNNEIEAAQQQHLAEATNGDESAQQLVENSGATDRDESAPVDDCGDGDGRLSPNCCIYRVPTKIRGLKEEAYTPTVVSVGPLHYGNKRLKDMERHKQIIFKRFTQRVKLSLDDLIGRVTNLEPQVRASYSETIKFSKQDLVKLTVIDAGFIIELFLISYMDDEDTDAKLSMPWLDDCIRKDLMLIENQLPFFAIEKLFNEAFPRVHCVSLPPFLELTYEYFGYFNKQKLKPNPDVEIKHFTDLFRLFYLPGEMSEEMSKQQRLPTYGSGHLLYSANALQEAGIQLKTCESKCLLDLKLSGHTLQIPQIFVEDTTELVFRNIIALEQCYYPYAAYITDYALLLDCLVDTHKDVDLLIDKKIVIHYLGDSNNVAELFNGLWKNVLQSAFNSQYSNICRRLNDYCHNPWHRKKATLRRDYCNTPWRTTASIAGIILLVLTVVQTIFSVLQVVLK